MMDLAMPGRLSDDERATIAELLRSGVSRTEIVKRTGRSRGTIANVAQEIGYRADQSAAERTRNARAARSAFSAEHRATTAATAQQRADEILATFWDKRQQVVVMHGQEASTEIVEVEPDARAISDLAKVVNTLQRTVLDISKHDVKADEGNAGGLLVQFVDQLRGPSEQAAA